MIAVRRARKRTLIRSSAMNAFMARSPSPVKGVARSQYPEPLPQPELILYLRQLTTLYEAGVLTDKEYSAARGRLLGS